MVSVSFRSGKIVRAFFSAFVLVLLTVPAATDEIRFLVPAGEGSGWDTTARAVGAALEETGIAEVTGYENLSGAGGSRALMSLINESERHQGTLMIQSTPLILRNLTGVYSKNWQDVTPIATMISAYQAVAVPVTSPYENINELLAELRATPSKVPIAGGSSQFSLDHLTLGLIAQAAGLELNSLRYSPADGGKEALDRMLAGNVKAVVSGLGELLPAASEGQIRILGVTSAEPIPGVDAPTLKSQGLDVVFANWRGFFAAPGTSEEDVTAYREMLITLSETEEWGSLRSRYKWEPFVLTGDDLAAFLEKQQAELALVLDGLKN
jgi:putative tricarboxylic transport membrane protein